MTDLDVIFHDLVRDGVITYTHPLVRDIQFGEHGDQNEYLEIVVVLRNGLGLVDTGDLPRNEHVANDGTGVAALVHAVAFIDRCAKRPAGAVC